MNGPTRLSSIPPVADDEGNSIDNQRKAEVFASTFAKASNNQNLEADFAKRKNIKRNLDLEEDHSPLSDDISIAEVREALDATGNSSSGPDGIHYSMLRHLPQQSLEGVLALMNQSWREGRLPKSWKEALVIPIHKKGKPANEASSYRPISLTSCLCKLLERVITTRLRWFLETNGLLNPNQAGFRSRRSCADQLARISYDIAASCEKKRMTLAVFLDIEKAFDMVWREGIILQLTKMGIKGPMIHWIQRFLHERSFKVGIGDALSKAHTLENGTPQGSVLNPLLFIIMMNNIPEPRGLVQISMFADDIAIWIGGTNLAVLQKNLQVHLDNTANFLTTNGFRISTAKSVSVLFSKVKNVRDEGIQLKIAGTPLPRTEAVTFLGITLDDKMSWGPHSKGLMDRCKKRLNALRAISGNHWGASKTTLLKVYRATIRSLLEYGCEATELAAPSVKKKWTSIQRQALSICCRSFAGTSLDSLQVECGEVPLDLRRRKFVANHAAKALITPDSRTRHCYFPSSLVARRLHCRQRKRRGADGRNPATSDIISCHLPEWMISGLKTRAKELASDPPWRFAPPIVDTSIAKMDACRTLELTIAREKIHSHREDLVCYTDASKTKDGAGIGVFIPKTRQEISHSTTTHSCISSTELMAIETCLQTVHRQHRLEPSKVVIFSDSLSALEALKNRHNAYHDPDIYRVLKLISDIKDSGKEVSLVWIPAHVGIQGNEKADQLAKAAATKKTIEVKICPSFQDAKRHTASSLIPIWQSRWDASSSSRYYHTIEGKVTTVVKFQDAARRKEILISRLRLGKIALNQHLHKLKIRSDGKCGTCPDEDESPTHFLMECPAQAELREKILRRTKKSDLREMLSNPASTDLIYEWVAKHRPNIL